MAKNNDDSVKKFKLLILQNDKDLKTTSKIGEENKF